jgi:ATP-dependent DNA helicase RecG
MTKRELLNLMRLGEGLTLEFKRSVSADLGREVCAFANAIGGRIVVGADDRGSLVGVSNINRTKSEIQSIARNVDPPIAVEIEPIENVLLVTVPAGSRKPHMVGGKFYMREAATTQQLNRDEIREFFFKEGLISFDKQICRGFDMDRDFDPKKYRAFARAADIPSGMKTEDVLRNLEVLTDEGMSNAGALFFSKRVPKFFLEAKINCVLFQGTGKTKILDQQIYEGNIVETHKAAIAYLEAHLNTEYVIRSGPRQEILELPVDALREAILNAIGHRDYRLTGHIQVHISLDRAEIINPGGLVSGLKLADLGRVSMPRNPLLFALMHRLELVEDVGSGIRRIRTEMKNYGLENPLIETGEAWFSIAFKRKSQDSAIERQGAVRGITPSVARLSEGVTGGVSEGVTRLLKYIRLHPGLRTPAISEGLSVPVKTIERWVKLLKQQGEIQFRGSPKKGGYHALPPGGD